MSYATGPATSAVTLLDTFMAFCVAAGWVQDQYVADGTGKQGHLHKGTNYVHLRSFIEEHSGVLGTTFSGSFGSGIAITAGNGFGANVFWERQPGVPITWLGLPTTGVMTAIMPLPPGAIQKYWMFADPAGDNIVLVALRASGIYSTLNFGTLIKPQAYPGGFTFSASRGALGAFDSGPATDQEGAPPGSFCAFLNATVDAWSAWENLNTQTTAIGFVNGPGKRLQCSTGPTAGFFGVTIVGDHVYYGVLRKRARSTRTSGLVLLPTLYFVERDFGGQPYGGGWSYAGQLPDVFQTTLVGFVPGQQYMISTDAYIVFPEFAIRQYP